jgi:hypothetical protein
MRIHFTQTDPNNPLDIAYAALIECQKAGTVAGHVGFKTLTVHRGGQGFAYALEIQLEGMTRDRGRRLSSYGAGDNYTATYDEWGFFLAALYRMDEGARCAPNFKRDYAVYYDASDFHEKTGRTYDPAYPDYVERHGDDYGYRTGRALIGRRGAGRVHYDSSATRWAKEDPRTADFLRKLHAGEVF